MPSAIKVRVLENPLFCCAAFAAAASLPGARIARPQVTGHLALATGPALPARWPQPATLLAHRVGCAYLIPLPDGMPACSYLVCRQSQGDHTIIATPRATEGTTTPRARAGSAGPISTPTRKTPSPRPTPSPTHGSSHARTKTPPPPPIQLLSSRSSAGFSERERRSPKTIDRHSPTQGKGASSPTEGPIKPRPQGHIRSMSASTTPTPPPNPSPG